MNLINFLYFLFLFSYLSYYHRGMAVSLPSGHSDEWGLPPVIGQLTVFTDSRAIPVGISLIPVALPCAQLVKFCTHFIAHCYIYWIVYDLEDGGTADWLPRFSR